MSLNRVVVMGRITRDLELKRTNSGVSVVSLTLAVDRDFKNQNGEKDTDFIDVVAYRNTAEFLSKYFGKGRMAVVEGRLQIRDWTDKDGNKRRNAEIIADNVYFGDSRQATQPDNFSNQEVNFRGLQRKVEEGFALIGEEDAELPF